MPSSVSNGGGALRKELAEARELIELTRAQKINATLTAEQDLDNGVSALLVTDAASSTGGDTISHADGVYTNTGADAVTVTIDANVAFVGALGNGERAAWIESNTTGAVVEYERVTIDAGDHSHVQLQHQLSLDAGAWARIHVYSEDSAALQQVSVSTDTIVELTANAPASLDDFAKTSQVAADIEAAKTVLRDENEAEEAETDAEQTEQDRVTDVVRRDAIRANKSRARLAFASGKGRHVHNGKTYATRADMVADGVIVDNGQSLVVQPVRISDNLLDGIDFGDFTEAGGTFTQDGEEWIFDTTSGSGHRRAYFQNRGICSEAVEFACNAQRISTGNGSCALSWSKFNNNLSSPSGSHGITSTSLVPVNFYADSGSGVNWYLGIGQQGGTAGQVRVSEPQLYKATAAGIKNSSVHSAIFALVMPDQLPATKTTLYIADVNGPRDYVRMEWETNGDIIIGRRLNAGAGASDNELTVNVGNVQPSESATIGISISRTRLIGALNGQTVSRDIIGTLGVAFARFGQAISGAESGAELVNCELYEGALTELELSSKTRQGIKAGADLIINGDSYTVVGSSGIAFMLADAGYNIVPVGAGGSTFAQQLAVIQGLPQYNDLTHIWWDGSPNGHVGGQIQNETDAIDAWVSQIGHDRWLYVRNGQIYTGSDLFYNDMTAVYQYVIDTYGSRHVYDPEPIVRQLSDGSENDLSDIDRGRYPRSTLYDNVHLDEPARRLIVEDMRKYIDVLGVGD